MPPTTILSLDTTTLSTSTQSRLCSPHLCLPFIDLTHQQYIQYHPKIELHAHISGSINEQHLTELITQHWPEPHQQAEKLAICKLLPENIHDTRDLDECFALFKVLHHIIDSKEIIHMVTLQVLEDFVFRDNCVYLELRTTPRPITNAQGDCVVTSEEYIITVCKALQEFRMIIAYLAQKYNIITILNEFNITIDHYPNLNQYSPYAQKIINKFDVFYCDLDLNDDSSSQLNAFSPLSLSVSKSPIETHIMSIIHTNKYVSSISNSTTFTSPIEQTKERHFGNQDYTIVSSFRSIASFISCGILFSIDRASFSPANGQELLDLLCTLKSIHTFSPLSTSHIPACTPQPNSISELILGLDFSGNPFAVNKFGHFHSIWRQCRSRGLFTSIHVAETPHEGDSNDIFRYYPHRLGHVVLIDKIMYDVVTQGVSHATHLGPGSVDGAILESDPAACTHRIGVEICLTSNRACKLHQSINTHPVVSWISYNSSIRQEYINKTISRYPSGTPQRDIKGVEDEETIFQAIQHQLVPITLCTDDSGVFSCSLVDEWKQLLRLTYFNHTLQHNELTIPITNNPHTNNPVGHFELPCNGLQDNSKLSFSLSQQDSTSKLQDFQRINHLVRTGIMCIFQQQYLPLVQTVFQRFSPQFTHSFQPTQ